MKRIENRNQRWRHLKAQAIEKVRVTRFCWLQWKACRGTHRWGAIQKGPVSHYIEFFRALIQGPLLVCFDARCIGEKKINSEDCFIIKLCADPRTLNAGMKAKHRS
ncbi:hypothetical protein AAG906_038374 [Vitis piasezkii]